jgi:hypothetical protein
VRYGREDEELSLQPHCSSTEVCSSAVFAFIGQLKALLKISDGFLVVGILMLNFRPLQGPAVVLYSHLLNSGWYFVGAWACKEATLPITGDIRDPWDFWSQEQRI